MLTEAEIRRKLKEDPFWEPEEDVSDDDWILFEEVREEVEKEEMDALGTDEKGKKNKKELFEEDFDFEDEVDWDKED